MKIILHIGTSKAGSTTIQSSFEASHELLQHHDVLFPISEKLGKTINYRLLSNALSGVEETARADRLLGKIEASIEETNPRVLFLSTEFIWGKWASLQTIRSKLSKWSDDIVFLGVLREPSEYYKSKVQQQLKSTGRMINPYTWSANYLRALEGWCSGIDQNIELVTLDKNSLRYGCLVHEIAQRFFPNVLDNKRHLSVVNQNSSDPSEVTYILQNYQLGHYENLPRARRDDVVTLRKELLRICSENGIGSKPVLHSNVQETILSNHSKELHQLRDRWGVTFSNVKYDKIRELKRDENLRHVCDYSEVCLVSGEVVGLLTEKIRENGLIDKL